MRGKRRARPAIALQASVPRRIARQATRRTPWPSELPRDLLYHPEHDWARIDGDEATLRDHLVRAGRARRGRLLRPARGRRDGDKDQPYAEVESVKAVSDVIAPLSGEIVEVNEALADAPERINEDPYGEGWMVKVQL